MLKRKPRVVEWNSCIDVPLSRGVLGNYFPINTGRSVRPGYDVRICSLFLSLIDDAVHVLLLDRCTRPAEKRGTAHADLLVGAQVLADQCKQSAGDSIWVSPTSN